MLLLIQAQNQVDNDLYYEIEELLDLLDLEMDFQNMDDNLPSFVKEELLKMNITTNKDNETFE